MRAARGSSKGRALAESGAATATIAILVTKRALARTKSSRLLSLALLWVAALFYGEEHRAISASNASIAAERAANSALIVVPSPHRGRGRRGASTKKNG